MVPPPKNDTQTQTQTQTQTETQTETQTHPLSPKGGEGGHVSRSQLESEIYALYPRKVGKTEGLDRLTRKVRTAADLERCRRAVSNYAAEVRNTDPKYVKHFSTWTSCWEDYVDGSPIARAPPERDARVGYGPVAPHNEEGTGGVVDDF